MDSTRVFGKVFSLLALVMLLIGALPAAWKETSAQEQRLPPLPTLEMPGNWELGSKEVGNAGIQSQQIEFLSQVGGSAGGNGQTSAVAALGSYIYFGIGRRLEIANLPSPNNPAQVSRTTMFPDDIRDIAVAGDYAYIADGTAGLRVVDVSSAASPREVGFWDTPGHANGVYIDDHYAYVADGDAGLRIVDVSNPAAPYEVGAYNVPTSASSVAVSGSLAYLADYWTGVRILDISNPAAPSEIGSYVLSSARGIAVAGSYAYVTASSSGLWILDVVNPAAPQVVGYYEASDVWSLFLSGSYVYLATTGGLQAIDVSTPTAPHGAGICDSIPARDVAVSGHYAFVMSLTDAALRVVDVANPAALYEIGSYEDQWRPAGQVAVDGSYAYVAAGTSGLWIVDASVPTSLREASVYDTPGVVQDVSVAGAYAYVADEYSGLLVVDVSNPTLPRETGSCNTVTATKALSVVGPYAYLATGGSGLWIVDASDPSAPYGVGLCDTPGDAQDVFVSGSYAYVADGDSGLRVIDVSSPTVAFEVGSFSTAPERALRVSVSGSYAYLVAWSSLRVVDISNPAAPHEVGTYGLSAQAYDVAVVGSYAYVTRGDTGLLVIDVSNPASPQRVGYYDTRGQSLGVAGRGPYIFVGDGDEGLALLWSLPDASASIPTTGGELDSAGDGTTYAFPAGTFTDTVTVTHSPRFSGNLSSPGNLVGIGHTFEVTATYSNGQVSPPVGPYTITVRYTGDERGPAVESTLALYSWDGSQWSKEPSSRVDLANHTVIASPDHFSLWAVFGETYLDYLPLISRNFPLAMDLTIDNLEVTQAVQSLSNTVPLVADRPTVVRAYARASGTGALDALYLSLEGSRNGQPLPGSPLTMGPWAVFPVSSRDRLGTSFNLFLPAEWLSGTVTLVARIDPGNAVRETDEGNNTVVVTLDFNPVPALDLKIVPVNYTDLPSGMFFPAPTADTVSDWVFRSYPLSAVSVSFHTPIDFSGDLSQVSEWDRLLDQVIALKLAEGAPHAQVYYGLIPSINEEGYSYYTPIYGLGAMFGRYSIGLDKATPDGTGQNAAHELGHNFGRLHAPCGDPGFVDPNYPYPDASIGQYGLDVIRMRLWSPVAPDYAKDVMSYCGPTWFSDYNYQALYEDQRENGRRVARAPVTDTLLFRVHWDPDGLPSIQPAYALLSTASDVPATSEYSLELLDVTGRIVASQPVRLGEIEEEGIVARAIYANVPLPTGGIFATLRLVRGGQVVAERALGPLVTTLLDTPQVEQTADTLVLRWGAPEVPALVRYTVDDGRSWTTVGLDVLGGELRLDPRTLPGGAGRFEITLADTVPPIVRVAPLPTALPDTVPQVWITGPTTSSAGRPVILSGHATDREHGALIDLHWVLDGKEVQAGQTLQLDSLLPGEHTVVLTVYDRGGHRAQAEHTVLVLP